MANPHIRFEPFREEHLGLLRAWLREPHVAEFWQEDETKLRQKFLHDLAARGVSPHVIYLHESPAGYIQHYEARKVGGGWWPGVEPGVFGIDQFLGNPALLGRGLGTAIISQFVTELFRDEAVKEIIADPEPRNSRAIRAFMKAGFSAVGEIDTPGGRALLLRRRR